ncbi:hypothetical protein KRX11_10230 [Pasteurellaceae bacterium TAE3-ERU1]|uniref:hypothetical protein n=1 Tax=Spirabiliibacterium mucosae TaxID=28156 RepID=UPI001AACAEDA|nr:hypothetical protein [Spirabiliibacterium mucosae]MBE2898120.1 hypothetical protein [Spirabiliibacterium mucosae]MBV7389005.1 hypothetical protein [Pasteurellaceae bacterium TAE3-ERU1]
MKPFDLEKALAGEPVKLHGGHKAFILGVIPDTYKCDYKLLGYFIDESGSVWNGSWNEQGELRNSFMKEKFNIVGMWEEPNRIINGIEVPPCVTEETWEDGEDYYYASWGSDTYHKFGTFFKDDYFDRQLVQKGLVFETEEGAIAMTKALLNYKVEEK